jgi:eukaryotic-like serine/threonine-protein kinase
MSGPSPPEDRPARPGDLLGHTIAGKFVIEAVIGTGAMGVVYRAKQTALDKVVAIKVMHGGLVSDETFAARFHREAKAASRLDHPNSIRILDFGQEPDGRLYIAMDYLDGRDLLEVINHEWPLSTARMVDILAQALSALAVAHELGILHRDLKPENIMVQRSTNDDGSPADSIKVCDFGIAKIIERDEDPAKMGEKLSTGGIVVGTPAYMSPEQARGDAIDARCDVYAMGVILYQMLTMRVPFDAPTPLSTLLRLVSEQPALPSSVSSYVDPKLEAVCVKAMSKNPADRYQSAREMRVALRGLADAERADATPAGEATRHALREAPTSSLPALDPAANTKPARRAVPAWVWTAAAAAGAAAILLGAIEVRRSLASRPRAAASGGGALVEAPAREVTPVAEAPHAEVDSPTNGLADAAPPTPSLEERPPVRSAHAPAPARAAEPARVDVATTNVGILAAASTSVSPPVSSVVASAPAAPVAPTHAPPPAIVAAPRPVDPANARVEIGSASNTVGTTAASVGKAIGPATSRLVACYRTSLASGVVSDGPATLHLETNDEGVVTDARLDAHVAPPLAGCITGAVRGRKIANVDTGSASADVPLVFRSR